MIKNMANKINLGKNLYIIEAALEHLISILVAGSFLATLTKQLGVSDEITGIISSFISLGCAFQLLSVFAKPKRNKPLVVAMSVINQILFTLLYIIPLTNMANKLKIVLLISVIVLAYLLYYFVHPKKINWLMSLVEDGKRGTFTANKEIVSLLLGTVFTFAMGAVVDHFREKGEIKTAFIISAVVLFSLTVLHTLSMVFTVEIEETQVKKTNIVNTVKDLLKNKNVLRIILIFVLFYVAKDISAPFYSTYQINDLGFSMKLISIMAMVGSITRVLISRFWGKYADKTSFARMIEKCFLLHAAAFLFITFATPATGKVIFVIYHAFHGLALAGINSALTNLVFDYVSHESRADSLAFCQAFSGVVGFLATVAVSPLVATIQSNNNIVFGMTIYAQQILSFVSFLLMLLTAFYVRKVFIKK